MGKWLEKVKQLESPPLDADAFINCACLGLPVDAGWVKREVLDDFDIKAIAGGKISKECLAAHIRYQMNKLKIVGIRRQGTYKTYKT